MNILYSLLTSSIPESALSADYYGKKRSGIGHTYKSSQLCQIIAGHVPTSRLPMFACVICDGILHTIFGSDIMELDPNNTYAPVCRNPNAAIPGTDPALCIYDLTKPARDLKTIRPMLDTDIQDRLITPSWIDYMGAACLQMLRETV